MNTTILIVEDETITALFIQHCLEKLGYEVLDIVTTGEEAIETANELRPDIILMDIMLDGKLNGIETTKIIYEKYNIPVVYLTAFNDKKTIDNAKQSGSFGYLLKPVDENVISPTLEIALSKFQQEDNLRSKNMWLNVAIKSVKQAIISTDNDFNVKFINTEAQQLIGYLQHEIINKNLYDFFYVISKNSRESLESILKTTKNNEFKLKDVLLISKQKDETLIDISIAPIINTENEKYGFIITFNKSQIAENENNLKKNDINDSLEQLKEMSNIITVCSFCKKIRDKDQWSRLEEFFQRLLNISFSHGICTDCSKEYYPEVFK